MERGCLVVCVCVGVGVEMFASLFMCQCCLLRCLLVSCSCSLVPGGFVQMR